MKLVIPVDEKKLDSTVCVSFGRAPFFLFYNTDSKESYFLDNSAIASQGGAGIKAAQAIVDENAQVLITPRCGENAEKVLKDAEITVYKSMDGCAQDNINAFLDSTLSVLNDFHAGLHGHH